MNQDYLNGGGRIRRGWLAAKSAWQVFKLDKELFVFPLIGFVLVAGIVVAGAIIGFHFLPSHALDTNSGFGRHWGAWATWIATALLVYLVSTYTSAALVGAALIRFRGGDPKLSDGFGAVRKRFGSLTAYALFNGGLGQILSFIESRVPFGGKILVFLTRVAWSIANIFSVPVIVDSKQSISPIGAVKGSADILKTVWAENVVSQLSVTAVFIPLFVLELFLFPFFYLPFATAGLTGAYTAIPAAIDGLLILGTIVLMSALSGIVTAALYHYATTGNAPEQFSKELMRQAFTKKKSVKVFS